MACGGENIQITGVFDMAPQIKPGFLKNWRVETRCTKTDCPNKTNNCTVSAVDNNTAAGAGKMDHVAGCTWNPPDANVLPTI